MWLPVIMMHGRPRFIAAWASAGVGILPRCNGCRPASRIARATARPIRALLSRRSSASATVPLPSSPRCDRYRRKPSVFTWTSVSVMSTTRPRRPLVPNFSSMVTGLILGPRRAVKPVIGSASMIRERGRGATTEEVTRTLQVFARAADTRKSYAANHAVVGRAISDLTHAFDSLLKEIPELVIDVGPDALSFQGERVLEGTEGSIPLALYRDGVRRLSFVRGVTATELEVVVSATAQGLSFGGMGDDVVTSLWRHQ